MRKTATLIQLKHEHFVDFMGSGGSLTMYDAIVKHLPKGAAVAVIGSPPYPGKLKRYGEIPEFGMPGVTWSWSMYNLTMSMMTLRTYGQYALNWIAWVCNDSVQDGRWVPSISDLEVGLHRELENSENFVLERTLIWAKNAAPNRKDYFRNAHEKVVVVRHRSAKYFIDRVSKPPAFKSGGKFRQRDKNGNRREGGSYPTGKANASDVIYAPVGGGMLGSKLAHLGKAPYPESLVDQILPAFADSETVVIDPFIGTGTTLASAFRNGVKTGIGIDIDPEQIDIAAKRLRDEHGAKVKIVRGKNT